MQNDDEQIAVNLRRLALKQKMLKESRLILESVDFLEKEIEQVSLEIDTAEAEYRFAEVEQLKERLLHLLQKLRQEMARMDAYMVKYNLLDNQCGYSNEEKSVLLSLSKEKQVSIRGFPTHPSGSPTGQSIQVKVEA